MYHLFSKWFKKKNEVLEAVSHYSLMNNRKPHVPTEVFVTMDATRQTLNSMFLAKDKQNSDLNFLNHIAVAKELQSDPRFVNTFK